MHIPNRNAILLSAYGFHRARMARKVSTEPIKQLLVELPLSEYQALEDYCLERQETKRQVIRSFIRRLKRRQSKQQEG